MRWFVVNRIKNKHWVKCELKKKENKRMKGTNLAISLMTVQQPCFKTLILSVMEQMQIFGSEDKFYYQKTLFQKPVFLRTLTEEWIICSILSICVLVPFFHAMFGWRHGLWDKLFFHAICLCIRVFPPECTHFCPVYIIWIFWHLNISVCICIHSFKGGLWWVL